MEKREAAVPQGLPGTAAEKNTENPPARIAGMHILIMRKRSIMKSVLHRSANDDVLRLGVFQRAVGDFKILPRGGRFNVQGATLVRYREKAVVLTIQGKNYLFSNKTEIGSKEDI
jgi:hypothetical protein